MNESSRIHVQLRAIPEPELPPVIWQRVESRHRQKIRQRKAVAGIATIAMVSVMAIPLLSPLTTAPDPDKDAHMAMQPHASSVRDVHEELRALDHALQVAYDRGASDAEIAPMWVARNELLANRRPPQAAARANRT